MTCDVEFPHSLPWWAVSICCNLVQSLAVILLAYLEDKDCEPGFVIDGDNSRVVIGDVGSTQRWP